MNLRELIKQHFQKEIKDMDDVAILFSGGTDSLTCLFSLLDMGAKPTLYSFHLEGLVHEDIEVSKEVAQYYNLKHVIVEIKRDIIQLQEDVRYIIKTFNTARKTNVQCTYPFLHILPHIKEKYVVSGLCADDLYGTAKSVVIKCSKDKSKFDETRRRIFSNPYSSAYQPIKELIELVHHKKFIAPYRSPEIIGYFMQFSWQELNKPKQKQIALDAFSDYFSQQDIYRRNSNLQVGSGIREWHDELLNTELNKNNRKRVDEIYKDIARGEV